MDVTTELASGFLVARYVELRPKLVEGSAARAEWDEVFGAFRRRIDERYVWPIGQLAQSRRGPHQTVPGFAILALDCLLIDTIQSFREGRVGTGDVSSAKSFKSFLDARRFASFTRKDRNEFFHYVRNALLHNGETRGDWKVRSNTPSMLSRDAIAGTRTLNRSLFHAAVVEELEDYCRELTTGAPEVREAFLRRMDAICGLVPPQPRVYFAYGSNLVEDEMLAKAPDAEPYGPAFVPGYRIVFNKHSTTRGCDAASIEKCPSRVLWGFLYRLRPEDEARLRKRESGYVEHRVHAWRVEGIADCEGATRVDAYTFIGKTACTASCGPTEKYRTIVVDGARTRALPSDYIATLER
jgi:cation transport regulator ChaC